MVRFCMNPGAATSSPLFYSAPIQGFYLFSYYLYYYPFLLLLNRLNSRKMLKWHTVLSFLLLHMLTGSVFARSCYYPDGTRSPNDVPCGDDENVDTHCCNKASICLDNRLCLNTAQPYALSRQSCTNKKWSSSCSAQCTKYSKKYPVTLFLLTEDPKNRQWTYCCSQVISNESKGNATCLNGESAFSVDPGEVMYGYAKLDGVQDPTTNTTTPTPSNKTDEDTSSSSSTGSSRQREVAIGAGVGVPLGAIAAAAIAWGIYERMQRRKALKSAAASAASGPYSGEMQPMMKAESSAYSPPAHAPSAPAPPPPAPPVELGQQEHQRVVELQGNPRM